MAGILSGDTPPGGETENMEPVDTIQLGRGVMMTMPGGWKMGQVQAQQPSTTCAEFTREVLNETARCLSMPYNVAAANSASRMPTRPARRVPMMSTRLAPPRHRRYR